MTSRALAGVIRSLRIYHGPDAPRAEMDALYAQFLKPGDLVFDIGAHIGDRTSSFRRLGAHVVALEPQPLWRGLCGQNIHACHHAPIRRQPQIAGMGQPMRGRPAIMCQIQMLAFWRGSLTQRGDLGAVGHRLRPIPRLQPG